MVYIHGGDWDHGSANVFPAQMLVASQNVTVVTFNYRLGPLGIFIFHCSIYYSPTYFQIYSSDQTLSLVNTSSFTINM